MTRREIVKLMQRIQAVYPFAYRDIDDATAERAVDMWHRAFSDVPNDIMMMALERLIPKCKYQPSISDFSCLLGDMYYEAFFQLNVAQTFGDGADVDTYVHIMDALGRFAKASDNYTHSS